jgi:hypothetical protein
MPLPSYVSLFHAMHDTDVSLEEFTKRIEGWEFHPVVKNKTIVAFFITKNNRIHCACLEEYKHKWFPKKMFNSLIKTMLDEYGSVVTCTSEDTRDFVERLGFKETGRNGMTINYIKTEV